jgi:hypothetical protein
VILQRHSGYTRVGIIEIEPNKVIENLIDLIDFFINLLTIAQ